MSHCITQSNISWILFRFSANNSIHIPNITNIPDTVIHKYIKWSRNYYTSLLYSLLQDVLMLTVLFNHMHALLLSYTGYCIQQRTFIFIHSIPIPLITPLLNLQTYNNFLTYIIIKCYSVQVRISNLETILQANTLLP